MLHTTGREDATQWWYFADHWSSGVPEGSQRLAERDARGRGRGRGARVVSNEILGPAARDESPMINLRAEKRSLGRWPGRAPEDSDSDSRCFAFWLFGPQVDPWALARALPLRSEDSDSEFNLPCLSP